MRRFVNVMGPFAIRRGSGMKDLSTVPAMSSSMSVHTRRAVTTGTRVLSERKR